MKIRALIEECQREFGGEMPRPRARAAKGAARIYNQFLQEHQDRYPFELLQNGHDACAKKADRAPRGAAHARGFVGLDDAPDLFFPEPSRYLVQRGPLSRGYAFLRQMQIFGVGGALKSTICFRSYNYKNMSMEPN